MMEHLVGKKAGRVLSRLTDNPDRICEASLLRAAKPS